MLCFDDDDEDEAGDDSDAYELEAHLDDEAEDEKELVEDEDEADRVDDEQDVRDAVEEFESGVDMLCWAACVGVAEKESSRFTLLATVLELRVSQILANLEIVLEGLSDSSSAPIVLEELLLPPSPPLLLQLSPMH